MLTRSDSSPPESAVGTTPALPPGGGRRMSGRIFGGRTPTRSSPCLWAVGTLDASIPLHTVVGVLLRGESRESQK
ncbi:hypothetical protein SAMN05428954_3281 [Streptomyces sp. 2112.3]|nr:hypothetical protein BX261_3994 [Streptomyces sp. 2321.6]SDR35922.1 hypothetical protein SAMN05216511_3204 [Streptomyces sp. KS_16]SED17220.1 hypothetical protein SAMN05428940_4021 [Streptomyces sp. 2133.1]SEE63747.1 hypothetical protein SAMN05428954_3281 [Streptomyces sp. 2112.3]